MMLNKFRKKISAILLLKRNKKTEAVTDAQNPDANEARSLYEKVTSSLTRDKESIAVEAHAPVIDDSDQLDMSVTLQWIRRTMLLTFFIFVSAILIMSVIQVDQSSVRSGYLDSEGEIFHIKHKSQHYLLKTLIKEGQYVQEGDLLFEFDSQPSEIALHAKQLVFQSVVDENQRYLNELTILKRIRDDATDAGEILFAEISRVDGYYKGIPKKERDKLRSTIKSWYLSSNKIDNEINSYRKSVIASKDKINLIDKKIILSKRDVNSLKQLVIKGVQAEFDLSKMHQKALDLKITRGNIVIALNGITQKLNDALYRMQKLFNDEMLARQQYRDENNLKIVELEKTIHQLTHSINTSKVRAPTAGWVMNVLKTNKGMTIGSEQVLAEILSEGPLKAVITIPSNLRGQVVEGQSVYLRVSHGKGPEPLEITGTIDFISASTQTDGRSQLKHYIAHVDITDHFDATLVNAGMPLTAAIIGDKYSVMTYLLRPIKKLFYESFL